MWPHLLRVAYKALLRRRAFTAIALVGIAVALGLVLTVAALLDATFGAHPPDAQGPRGLGLFGVRFERPADGSTMGSAPGYRFIDLTTRDLPGVADRTLFTVQQKRATFQTGARVEVWFKRVDAAFWRVMAFRFRAGAPFTDGDDRAGAGVAVIGTTTAARLFGGDAAAIGQTFRLGADTYRVVGVVDDVPFLRAAPFADVWVPLGGTLTPDVRNALTGDLWTLLVLDETARRADVQAAFQERLTRVPTREVMDATVVTARLETFFESTTREMFGDDGSSGGRGRGLFYGLVGLLGVLFLSIPALNLINLNLSRTMERAAEIGVRKAFGARPGSLTLLFLIEHTLLCLIGSALGLGVAFGLLSLLGSLDLLPYIRFIPSLRLFVTAVIGALVLSLLSGVYPAWRMARLHPVDALRRR